jgi:cytochrome oxidase Cu insertion factor (SCO1/SenC/PrrC family)
LHRFDQQRSSLALPELHGQAVWAAGSRRAPPFALRDQTGTVVSLASLRGRPALLAFIGSRCPAGCRVETQQLGWIMSGLPATERPTLLVFTVGSSGKTASAVRQLEGGWTWHWFSGTRAQLARIASSFGSANGPALLLIDSRGYERTGYLYPFQPPSVQADLARLATEGK